VKLVIPMSYRTACIASTRPAILQLLSVSSTSPACLQNPVVFPIKYKYVTSNLHVYIRIVSRVVRILCKKTMKILHAYLANSVHHFCEFCTNSLHHYQADFSTLKLSVALLYDCLLH